MLQQTRAQAVIPYYERFLRRFPTVEALAGCGRGRGAHAVGRPRLLFARAQSAARRAADRGSGRLSARLRWLARAAGHWRLHRRRDRQHRVRICRYAVVDGNVLRVVARVENDAADIGSARTRERFREIAQSWLDTKRSGAFNQAMMELGATVCLPKNPLCQACPLSAGCRARAAGTVAQLPVKLRRTAPVKIEGTLLIVRRGGRILLRQREPDASRMAGFWDLPSARRSSECAPATAIGRDPSHHYASPLSLHSCDRDRPRPQGPVSLVRSEEMETVPLSTTARKALRRSGFEALKSSLSNLQNE